MVAENNGLTDHQGKKILFNYSLTLLGKSKNCILSTF